MDTRADFQRLLEEMDNVIRTKQQELSELDERLESARKQLTDREATELKNYESLVDSGEPSTDAILSQQQQDYIQEQKALYELQLERFGEELNELEIINRNLAKENSSLRSELEGEMELVKKLKTKCKQLVDNLDEVHSANLELNLRLASAQSELQMQQRLLKKSHEEDEILMGAFNDKLESLNKAIQWRDEEIKQLKSDNQFALEHFGISLDSGDKRNYKYGNGNDDDADYDYDGDTKSYHLIGNLPDSNNKQRVIEIASVLRGKDTQIELLKSQLLQATEDLERNAAIIENLAKQKSNQRHQMNALNMEDHYSTLTGCDLTLCTKTERELVAKYKNLENELEIKDRQLNALEVKNYHYETILPDMISSLVHELTDRSSNSRAGIGSSELLNGDIQSMKKIKELSKNLNRLLNELNTGQVLLAEIDNLKRLNEEKGLRIELLVQRLNQLDAKYSPSQQQSDAQTLADPQVIQSKTVQFKEQVSFAENQSKRDLSEYDNRLEVISSRPAHSSLKPNIESGIDERASNVNMKNAPECQELDINNNSNNNNNNNNNTSDSNSISSTTSNNNNNNNEGWTNDQSINTTSDEGSRIQADCSIIDSSASTSNKFTESSKGCESKRSIKQLVQQPSIKTRTKFGKPTSSSSISLETIDTAFKLRSRLRQLESENELLELAMKEILLSIKWSDAQCSTILIDCPSLERLCQLIEARFMSEKMPLSFKENDCELDDLKTSETPSADSTSYGAGGLFQLIVLKSELDLLRGQNEQLRADIKAQRREYQELLIATTTSNKPHFVEIAETEEEANRESAGISGNTDNDTIKAEESELELESSHLRPESLCYDVECQTEQLELVSQPSIKHIEEEEDRLEGIVVSINSDHQGEVRRDVSGKCHNCARLVRLANHLLQCIVRVETRVHVSEETFMSRLISLHNLIHVLDRDISIRENLLNNSRRECHLLKQEKCLAEARLHFLESQMSNHMKSCSVSHLFHGNGITKVKNMKVISTAARNGNDQPIIKSDDNRGPTFQVEPSLLKNARMTITLLHSIINCLQARLDYKDERLQHLEGLLSEEAHHCRSNNTTSVRFSETSRITVNS